MDFKKDLLKKKIIYRATYRGTKEMDKLLGAFVNKYIENLTIDNLLDLEKLLEIDDNNLYNFYNDIKTDIDFNDTYINKLYEIFRYHNNN